ncbi:MAG: FkbM family methyltransferase [Minisyncoccia bacterium]
MNPPKNPEISFDLRDDYPTDSIVIKEIWEENVYEVKDTHFNCGGVVIDMGANIGAFSVYAAQFGATVYAIEPEPHNLDSLKKNIAINEMQDKIYPCPYAISNYKGVAVITDEGGGATIKDDGVFGAEVEVMPFDMFFDLYHIAEVDVLKIDTEGAEVEIILGASKENLQKCKYITMEFDIRSGNKMGDMVQKLSETHHVRTMGSWKRGGMIWAWIY